MDEDGGRAAEVRHDEGSRRYVAFLDGDRAGFTAYQPRAEARAFTHTEVEDRFEGMGVGSALVRGALDDCRAQGIAVLPYCPFVASWLQRHPEYVDLVPERKRADFDLPTPT